MNVNTMTTDAIRDELARREGWCETTPAMCDNMPVPLGSEWHKPTGSGSPGSLTWCIHPIPATLDEAAKLPAPWKLSNLILWADNRIVAEAIWPQCENRPIEAIGDTELEARFRLRLACTLAAVGHKEDALRTLTESEPKPCP